MLDFRAAARGFVSTVAVLLAVGVVGGCAPSQPPAPAQPPAPVVLPGAPGDEPRVATSEELGRIGRSEAPAEAEADYVRMMIRHHEQALEMTALAAERGGNPKVRALADRIGGAQAPEIGAMRGWLATHRLEESGAHGHGRMTMPGAATPEQITQLAGSRGADFDRLFLQLMIAHHEGATTMATDLLKQGLDEQVQAMAQDVLVTQTDEIGVMRGLLAEVGPS